MFYRLLVLTYYRDFLFVIYFLTRTNLFAMFGIWVQWVYYITSHKFHHSLSWYPITFLNIIIKYILWNSLQCLCKKTIEWIYFYKRSICYCYCYCPRTVPQLPSVSSPFDALKFNTTLLPPPVPVPPVPQEK